MSTEYPGDGPEPTPEGAVPRDEQGQPLGVEAPVADAAEDHNDEAGGVRAPDLLEDSSS